MKADFSGLTKLQQQIWQMTAEKDRLIEQAAKELAKAFLKQVKKATPVGVGKTHGNLRRRWVVKDVKKVGNAYTCTVTNPVEYASYVEYGHRTVQKKNGTRGWVEGQFMMTLSAEAIKRVGDTYVERKFEEFLRRHWNGK